jgi:hypothetical protein
MGRQHRQYNRVDLHYHSEESDGMASLEQSYERVLELNVPTLCVTNHLDNGFRGSYAKTIDNAKRIDTMADRPIIVGIELKLPDKVLEPELLVYGTNLCEIINEHYERLCNGSVHDLIELKQEYEHESVFILCHPKDGKIEQAIAPALDGVEITYNGGVLPNFLFKIVAQMKEFNRPHINYTIKPFANSDGHTLLPEANLSTKDRLPFLGEAYNFFNMPVGSEEELILAVKNDNVKKFFAAGELYIHNFERSNIYRADTYRQQDARVRIGNKKWMYFA